jgi:hypothetical protein
VVNKNKEAAVKKKFAKEEAKSFHIHLPHFLCYFLVGLMLNPIQWESHPMGMAKGQWPYLCQFHQWE